MSMVGTGSWSISYPDEWEGESNGGVVSIRDPDGPGILQISSYRKPGGVEMSEVLAAAKLSPAQREFLGGGRWGDFEGFQLVHSEGDVFWRKWWLKKGEVHVFVTYNCPLSDKDAEAEVVNEMMDTLSGGDDP